MLQPKRTKYHKSFRGKMRGKSLKGSKVNFGSFGLKSLSRAWVTARQIEAARKVISNVTKRKAKVWIRVFPHKPATSKGNGSPMGAGKGEISHWVAVVKPGRILFEIGGVSEEIIRQALKLASHKLSIKTKIVGRIS